MATNVYKLDIIYPEGSHEPGWEPARWRTAQMPRRGLRRMRRPAFRWPRERMFLSCSAAYGRAWLLRAYGADVEVLRSDPVTWAMDTVPPEARISAMDRDVVLSSLITRLSGRAQEIGRDFPEYDRVGLPLERKAGTPAP